MTVNYTMPTNITSITDWMQWGNVITGNWYGIVLIVMIFVITYISLKDYPNKRAFAAAAFITGITTVLLRFIGLVDTWTLSVVIAMNMVGIIVLLTDKEVY